MEPKVNLVEAVGLCTSTALQRLATAIEQELRAHESRLGRSRCRSLLPFSSRSADAATGRASSSRDVLHRSSACLMALAAALAAVAAGFGREGSLVLELAVLAGLLLLNLGLVRWDGRLRRMEMVNHTWDILRKLKELQSCEIHWPTHVYSPLFRPTTQSITEQWTYRDGHLVSLPTSLLVKEDVILIKPGQASPTTVCSFDDHSVQLERGEKFQQTSFAPSSKPTARQPLKPLKFLVLDTPYIPHLRACLQQGDNGKPAPLLEVKRTLCVGITERWLVPCILAVSLCVNVLRFVFCGHDVGLWSEMLITLQVNTILPLLSLTVPLLWIILISYGNARIVTLFHKAKYEKADVPGDEIGEVPEVKDEKLSWRELWEHFLSAFFGPSSHLPRSASLLYGLGTITSLCCVDKRGILSFPDPTIEKVFFMSNLHEDSDGSEASTSGESDVFASSQEHLLEAGKKGVTIASQEKLIDSEDYFPEYHTEVLTLSLDSTQNPTSLQFDETNWERHINSLKPMGLNILLNTCNPDTVEKYSHLFNHVHSSVNSDDTMEPLWVAHRRCMCQLAYLIGFTEQATQTYEMHQQLALYHPVNLESEDSHSRHHAHRTRSFIKKRTPIPHIMSVLMKDSRGGANQLLTEGTAELVLSLCTDFWDGSDLSPLDDNDRKKILDFYQRAALSSYCCAFAYQPMADSVAKYFDDLYVELPPGGKAGRLPPDFDNFGVARSSWDVDMTTAHRDSRKEEATEGTRRKYHSLDSPMDKRNNIRDAEDCFRAQCGQIFIGMVAMNYQAKPDIVALIENLDHACVRFVHFSRDQELRSRVFSEKMGLEAGWNCHVSLQSEPGSGRVSRQHSEQSSSVKSDPSRRSLEVAANLGATAAAEHPKEVEADVANLKVLWHGQGEADGAAGRERTRSGGKETRRDANPKPARIPEEEDPDEDQPTDETSQLLASPSSPDLGPKSTASAEPAAPSPNSRLGTAGNDCSNSAPSGRLARAGGSGGKNRGEVSAEAEEHPNESSALLPDDDSSPAHRPTSAASRSADSAEPPHAQLRPHFADSGPPEVQVSCDNGCQADAGLKSNLEVLSEEMSVSWRERNVSDAARTMSDDTETLSHVTESETAVGFDISNRAKLPRGIEKIRPHLETVDNVPLLVPLFTDVTPETTQEMLKIMQDYGEVVCCLGSSLNILNMPLFAQADISIGVEPLHPHICLHRPQSQSQSQSQPQPQPQPLAGPNPYWHTPSGLASLLASLPCSMSFLRYHNFSLFSLVQEARGLCTALCTVFTFLMFALLSLSGLQLVASALLLPPPLAGRHVLWLAVVVAPVLATSLFPSQLNRQTMTSATGKNLKHRDNQVIQLYAFYFLARFAVSVFVVLLCHALTLHAFCQRVTTTAATATSANVDVEVEDEVDANATHTCHLLLGNRNSASLWNGLKGEHFAHLVLAQNIQTALMLLYLIVTSVTYVHNLKPLWKKRPFTNHMWCATVLILLLLQVIYFVLDVRIWSGVGGPVVASLANVPMAVWLIAFLWPVAILVLNEAVKLVEIRVFVRWQRRAQLQFGTKLGMNSPF